jgi:integrase
MLFRMVRPMRRKGSRNRYYVRRIPVDVRARAIGLKLTILLGDGESRTVTIAPQAQSVRFSLGTDDPMKVKARSAAVDAHLERVWRALRADAPVKLSPEQAEALAGRLYRAWTSSERRERTIAVEQGADGKMHIIEHDPLDDEDGFTAALARHVRASRSGKVMDLDSLPPADERPEVGDLEPSLGPLVNRLLLAEGIGRVMPQSRGLLLVAFWRALRDALESRIRNAQGDYQPDRNAERFPAWQHPSAEAPNERTRGNPSTNSLTALVEDWWTEAKRAGRKQSTYESYRNTMAKLVAFLKHDTASRVTPEDVVRFKDYRVQSGVSPKTVKDSDLAGMKTVFGWAVVNRRLPSNPAEGITIKVGKSRKLRSKGFYDSEAIAILKHAREFVPGREALKLAAAKRWVPWLCAFTGARVGEMIQIRKEDIRREGKLWVLHVTPEAGPVKTDEARDVVLHRQVIEEGFSQFHEKSKPGYLFIDPRGEELGVRKAVKTARNKVNAFVREVVKDPNVNPSHGWRHRFKTVGIEQDVPMRVLDALQGHAPRNASEDYGDVTIKARAHAIAKFPSIKVN